MMTLLDTDVIHAVDNQQIVAYYQPQIDLASGRIVAAEALARWLHPGRGMIPPSEFIPVAEKSGCIRLVGRRMLELACSQVRAWCDQRNAIEMSTNVSPLELSGDGFCVDVLQTLGECEVEPRLITLEITETAPDIDESVVNGCLSGAREAGLGISIDDFGTGYSSLQRMYRIHANELKLDRTLLQKAPDAEIETAIAAAHEIGARVVAEGVETRRQLDRARELGCERAQGYLLGRPMPVEDLNELLAAQ